MAQRIGDLANKAGVSVETVRFYEREGLIDQPPKPPGGWRSYGDAVQGQIGLVRLGRALGLSLADIKRLKSGASGSRPAFCTDVRQTVAANLAAIDAELAALQAKRAGLQAWLDRCRQRDAAACPLYDQVRTLVRPPAKAPR